jgi:diguanylate cyclase (GGDEF)-like protein
LRSASPVHIEYLKNMRVGSSMTISIIVERRLWGLIACHDPAPHIVDSATRSVCELLGEMLASQISLRIDNAELKLRLITRKLLEKCMAAIEASKSLAAAEPSVCTQLMDLFDADGLVWRSDDVVISYGTAVEEEKLQPVVTKMRKLASRGVATSNMLSALDRSGETYSGSVSGALYIGLSDWTGDYLLLMRRELVETVRWAGNPEKAVSSEAGGALHPRTSFAAWQETVRRRSRPWTELELEHAHVVREQLARLGEARRLRKFEERVRYLAHHDALTGLFNRDSINLKLEQCVNDAVADGIPFNVLFVDIDRFRYFNDRLGHAAGDEILKTLAARMTKLARSEDLVGRLGNDEFVVIVPGLSPSEAHATGLRILRGIEEPLGLEADPELKITASIGQSGYPADGTSGEVLVGRAYMAMFRTKQTGGNGLAAFTESQDQA